MLNATQLFTSRTFYWNKTFITEHTPSKESKGLFLFLHGFPAWVSKNYDVAELLALLGYKVYVPHHQGLGQSKGTFNFLENIEETSLLIKRIKDDHPNLPFSLFGHSWGGYLSLRHIDEVTDKLILLAPLAQFPKSDRRELLITNLYNKNKNDIPSYTREELLETFQTLEQQLNERVFNKPSFSPLSLLIYGTNDEVIPADLIAEFAKKIESSHHKTIVTDDDHRLSKRRPVLENIRDWVQSNS